MYKKISNNEKIYSAEGNFEAVTINVPAFGVVK